MLITLAYKLPKLFTENCEEQKGRLFLLWLWDKGKVILPEAAIRVVFCLHIQPQLVARTTNSRAEGERQPVRPTLDYLVMKLSVRLRGLWCLFSS